MSATSMRTHMSGELRFSDVDKTVSVCGWVASRREHGSQLAFVDVRDHTGVVQCVVHNDIDVRSEYVVRITGVVRARLEGTVNPNLPTGEIELGECVVEVLRTADALLHVEKYGEVCPANWKEGDEGMTESHDGVAAYMSK